MFERCFQCDFGWNKVKYERIRLISLFLSFFADIPLFFSKPRSTPGEGGTGKILAPVLALCMSFGRYGWAKSLVSRAILV